MRDTTSNAKSDPIMFLECAGTVQLGVPTPILFNRHFATSTRQVLADLSQQVDQEEGLQSFGWSIKGGTWHDISELENANEAK